MEINADCWIFIGGECPGKEELEKFPHPPLIIGADSGCLSALKMGYKLDWAVGDFDSADLNTIKKYLPEEKIKIFPRDKAYSDTELALSTAEELGAKSPWLIGGGGGRMDHMLAIIKIFNGRYIPAYWITAYERIFLIEGSAILDEKEGRTISFYPLDEIPAEVKSEGLVWELDIVAWKNGEFSLSNRIKKSPVKIRDFVGKLLAFMPHEQNL